MATGSVVTGAGTVNLSGGATLSASAVFDAGTTLSVASGVATLGPSCSVSGANLNLTGNGAVLLFDSPTSAGAVTISAGTLGGSSPLVVTGPLTLAGGTVSNALVTAVGGIVISGNTTLSGTKLINPTLAVWSAGNLTGANGAAISNLVGATFINNFDGNLAAGSGVAPLFINEGVFAKTNGTAAAGTTSINFQFLNTGTVEVRTNTLRYAANQQLAGLTVLDGGGLGAQAQPLQISGGSLVGTGLVTVANAQNVVNSSSLSPGLPLGELDIAGNYQQTASGNISIELGGYTAGVDFDLVTVTAGGAGGVATLGGTLNVSLVNGFVPTNGASFKFLTAASRAGAFATFNYPSNDIGMQLTYDAVSATLKVTNLKPVLANPFGDPAPASYGSLFIFQFPANTFSDPDADPLVFSATGLPPGIGFDSATRTFSGTPSQAGVYQVTVTATDTGTPALSVTNSFTLTVNRATLTVTADAQTKTYGTADPALTFTVSGLLLGDNAATVLTGALTRAPGESVTGSPYPIGQGTLAANGNYTIVFAPGNFTITPALLSVTADSKTKIYGAADPGFTVSYAGFVNGETPAVLGGTLLVSRAPGENVGSYTISASGLASPNYTITFNAGALTITKASLSISADDKTKVYGSSDPVFTVTYSGFVNGDTAASLGGNLVFGRSPGEIVGNYAITPGGVTSGNYAITFSPGTLSITRAALSITADSKTKIYGSADPLFTVSYSGFVNNDTPAVLGGTLSLSRGTGENVGSYSITAGGLTSGNYAITFSQGSLAITPALLTVTAQNQSKIYGSPDPAFSVSYAGFVNGDTAASLGGALVFSRAPGEAVGAYAIVPGGLTSTNYVLAFNPGSLAITPAALSISADDKTKTYGSLDPSLSVSYLGLVNGDTAASLTGALVVNRAPGENAGTYALTPGGLANPNYSISFNPGALTITKAPLSVAAESKSKTYGSSDPAFTVTYAGFVNNETPAVLDGTLAIVRTTGESVGSYLVTPGGLTSGNYALTFDPGTLTINPAPLTVTADSQSKTYGAADPVFTVTYAGFVNNETAAVLGGTLTIARAAGENVGGYALTPAGLTSINYAITFRSGTLTITRATLAVAASAKTKLYGGADPALTYTVNGLQFSDTAASVLSGALSRAAGESVAGGPYAIAQGTLAANANYALSFTGNTLTISPAPLSVTADSASKVYGAPDPAFTASFAGFVNGETAAVLNGVLALTRVPGEGAGDYAITPSGLLSSNYAITFNAATLTIRKAPLSITADSKVKLFGAVDPVFTVTYSGFVNGETAAALGGSLTITRVVGENLGTYAITPSGLTSGNYALTFNAGVLTIVAPPPAILSLTRADAGSVLTWTSVSNAVYRVQFKESLATTNWTDVPGDVLAGSSVSSKSDTFTSLQKFYRVQVVQ